MALGLGRIRSECVVFLFWHCAIATSELMADRSGYKGVMEEQGEAMHAAQWS